MDIPELGVFSPFTLELYLNVTGESPNRFLKRASVIFERLLLFPLGLGDMGGPHELISKERYLSAFTKDCSTDLNNLCKIVILDKDLIDNVESIYEELNTHEDCDLWMGTEGDKYIKFIENYVNMSVGQNDLIENWEAQKRLIGNIDADCKLFKVIQRNFGECSGLFTELHEGALLYTLSERIGNLANVVTTLSNLSTFDFGDLSWADIFNLRKSEFVKEFRHRLAQWALDYAASPDSVSFQRELTTFITEAKFDLIGDTAPKTRETVLSGIGGNIPFPFLVNPIGVYSSIQSIRHAHTLKNKYGWLFFIQRARHASKPNDSSVNDV